MSLILPDWPAPSHVLAGCTTRIGGSSQVPYDTNNLALHVGDSAATVLRNRDLLDCQVAAMSAECNAEKHWQWLNQVHGTDVVACDSSSNVPNADACFSYTPMQVATVMTADCLPVLLTDTEGTAVAAVHAGWRSLCYGVIENTVAAMREHVADNALMAWLGPAIGPSAFEVGEDVRAAFAAQVCGQASLSAFVPTPNKKYLADLYQLARLRLTRVGVEAIFGGDACTHSDASRFYSYRRDGDTGRMASFIMISESC